MLAITTTLQRYGNCWIGGQSGRNSISIDSPPSAIPLLNWVIGNPIEGKSAGSA